MADVRLAQNVDAVMTAVATCAGDHGTGVVDKSIHETDSIMTGAAVRAGQQMTIGFAHTDDIIVAVLASILIQIDRGVIEYTIRKCARRVAYLAILRCRQVPYRRFAQGSNIIVAADAALAAD